MGLFGWLKKRAASSQAESDISEKPAEQLSVCTKAANTPNGLSQNANKEKLDCRPSNMTISIEGNYEERPVFTYVGSALKGLRKGDYFYADVVKGPIRLVSELNGSVWQVEADQTALSYKGIPFGSFSFSSNTLASFIDLGCHIRIKCRHAGWYEKPIQEIVMQLPNIEQVWDWKDACLGLGFVIPFEDCYSLDSKRAAKRANSHRLAEKAIGHPLKKWANSISIFREDDEWKGPRPAKTARVDAYLSLLPAPAGSKAQPHILVTLNNMPALEISARSGASYKKLKQRVGDNLLYACISKFERPDGSFCWRLTLVFEGPEE